MRNILVLVFLFYSAHSLADKNSIAMSAFTAQPAIQAIFNKNSGSGRRLSVHTMPFSGSCGIAGCGWQVLVSLYAIPAGANPQSKILRTALVSGMSTGLVPVKVKFVRLKLKAVKTSF